MQLRNKKIIFASSLPVLVAGCDSPEVRYIYKEPTEAQINAAAEKRLAEIGKENSDLKKLLAELKAKDNSIQDVAYSNIGSEKVLSVTEKNSDGTFSSYFVPVVAAGIVGASTAVIAQKLMESKYKYKDKCGIPGAKALPECRNPYVYSYPSLYSSPSYNRSYHYVDYDHFYSDNVKRKREYYNSSHSPGKKEYRSMSSKEKAKTIKSNTKSSASLSTKQKVFSKKSTSRSRSFGSFSFGG